jgi:hypothetical protein
MHKRDYFHRQAVKTKDVNMFNMYKEERNGVVRMINEAQSNYYSHTIDHSENKNRDMWKSINKILNINKHSATLSDISADKFNSFFANIGKSLAEKIEKQDYVWKLPTSIHELVLIPIELNFVLRELIQLNNRSNLGVLNIDSKLLRIAAYEISNSLCDIINNCIMNGDLPDDWKLAKVTPIYKNKGPKEDCGNYRPISVICHIAKIMEKSVQIQLKEYLMKHNFISHVQSAYLKNHSTQSSLHNIVSDILDGINTNSVNMLCFLDLAKCFDTIDHDILLCKLEKYGIRGKNLKFFKKYLSGRKQCVKVNGQLSSILDILFGVPQGSILGPILFLLFINDLPTCLQKCECNLFADDTVIYTMNTDEIKATSDLQCDLDNVHNWFTANRLSINIDKSCTMSVTNKSRSNSIFYISDNMLSSVTHTKYLGVTICENLSWEAQIKTVCSKMGYGINVLYRLRQKKVAHNELLKIYNTIIQPYIDYCLTIWGYAPLCYINKIQRLQNRIVRIVTNNYDLNVNPAKLLNKLGLMSIIQRHDYFMSIQMFRCMQGTAPSYLIDRVEYSSNYNFYQTRLSNASMLYVPKPRIEKFRQSFQYVGPILYNGLPKDLTGSINLHDFTNKLLKSHIKLTTKVIYNLCSHRHMSYFTLNYFVCILLLFLCLDWEPC